MENRRDRFRQQLARLEGAGSPQAAIEAGWYVPRPSSSDRLARRIELKPVATRMLTGPIGSGKSTELLVLAKELSRQEDLWPVVIDVSQVHDLSDLQEGSLVAAAGIWLHQVDGIDSKLLKKLREAAYGTNETLRSFAGKISAAGLSSVTGLRLDAEPPPSRGLLHTPRTGSSIAWVLAEYLRDAVSALREGATPVLLFDSLDRVRDSSGFRTVLENDTAALLAHGFGVVLTAPVETLWTHSAEIRSLSDSWDTLPYEDPARDPAACDFLLEILSKRVDLELLSAEYRPPLVAASGGVLRDLIELTRNSVEEAYMAGRDHVNARDVDASISRFARGLSLGLDSTAITTLLSIQATHRVEAFDQETIRLLKSRQILEHHDPTSGPYFEVHPVLKAAMEQWARAS